MKTHDQWLVQVKQRFEDNWHNAMMWYPNRPEGVRYCASESEAKAVLAHAYKIWNGKKRYNEKGERYENQQCGMIGVSLVCTEKEDKRMEIVEHRIRKRTVTEWETVEGL